MINHARLSVGDSMVPNATVTGWLKRDRRRWHAKTQSQNALSLFPTPSPSRARQRPVIVRARVSPPSDRADARAATDSDLDVLSSAFANNRLADRSLSGPMARYSPSGPS